MDKIKKIIAIDLEMLCDSKKMEYEQKQTIRVGAVKYNTKTKELERFDAFVKPSISYPISEFCNTLTGITQMDVDGAQKYPIVLDMFLQWAGSFEDTLVITWGEDDIPRLIADAETAKLERPALKVLTDRSLNFQNVFTSEISNEQLSVENALKLLGLEFDGEQHRPCDDAYNTLRLYLEYGKNEVHNQIIFMEQICFKKKMTDAFQEWKVEVVSKDYNVDQTAITSFSNLVEHAWKEDITGYIDETALAIKPSHMQKIYNRTKSLINKYQKISAKPIASSSNMTTRLEVLTNIKVIAFKITFNLQQNRHRDMARQLKEMETQIKALKEIA